MEIVGGATHAESSHVEIESEAERLDRLGRQRPPAFSSAATELAFGLSIMLSIIMAVSLACNSTLIWAKRLIFAS